MVKLTAIGFGLQPLNTRIASIPPKQADAYYRSPEWQALRRACLKRDRYTCQLALDGCQARTPAPRGVVLIADHIVSRRNGGSDDLSNLRTVCRSCDNRAKEDHLGRRRGGAG